MSSPPPNIPYLAYRSKKHSRNVSSSHLTPNVSPPSVSRPGSSTGSYNVALPLDSEHREDFPSQLNGSSSGHQATSSADAMNVITNGVALRTLTPNGSTHPSEPLPPSPVASSSTITVDIPSPKVLPVSPIEGTPNSGSAGSSAGPSSPTASTSEDKRPRRASTFRRIPLRNSVASTPTRSPLSSSPLRPSSMQPRVRVASASATSSRLFDPPQSHRPTHSASRITSVSSFASEAERALHIVPSVEVFPSQSFEPPRPPVQPPVRISSLTPPSPQPPPKTPSPAPTSSLPTLSPAISPSPSASTAQSRTSAPYRPGFQPKGVYRPLTDTFLSLRRIKADTGRIERTKLERRLEKLIQLHFSGDAPRPVVHNRRQSSIFDLDIRNMDAGQLWRGVIQAQMGEKNDIRAAEQRITPWQDDADVTNCPLCMASFHPLTNRKHHCRLCGKIICSLPVKRHQRPVTCSILFVVDPKTKKIEEVGEGVDYGVRKRRSSIAVQGTGKGKRVQGQQEPEAEDEKFLKGVRICRECRPVLLRQQYNQEVQHVPTFVKLYEAFINLEKEIEDSLPQFQELILTLAHDDQPTKEASQARKRLLEAFAQYDTLSKRIRKLPFEGGPGSSQDRVQMAIMTRANLFLQKNMFPLQSLPKPKRASPQPASAASTSQSIDPDSELAHVLQPLLEQEALLESFVEEAKAHRKFEDAKTLKVNLGEIKAEIDRIFRNADADRGTQGGKGKGNGRNGR